MRRGAQKKIKNTKINTETGACNLDFQRCKHSEFVQLTACVWVWERVCGAARVCVLTQCCARVPSVSFKDHLYLHLVLVHRVCVWVCVSVCVYAHIVWTLTLHTWLVCETSFSPAHLDVYSFIYGKLGNHRPCLCLSWQWGESAQIYAWQQKLIRHQLTHANVHALIFFFFF